MDNKQQRRLMNYLFNSEEIPEHIRVRIEQWMLDQQDNPQLDSALRELWEGDQASASDEELRRGIEKLHASIGKSAESRTGLRAKLLRYAGVAAAVALIFVGGYQLAGYVSPKAYETITLITANNNVGEFTLPDGTKVWLNEESRLRYAADFSGRTRDVELLGEAFFEVHRDTLRPFRVRMKSMEVEVLGTSFDAIAYETNASQEIILKSGSVKVAHANLRRPLLLKPNEKFAYNAADNRCSISRVNAQNYCQWFATRLTFDNTRLDDIITNIERRYNVEIDLSADLSLTKRLSMTLYREPLEDIMEVLAKLVQADYKIDGNRIHLCKKTN